MASDSHKDSLVLAWERVKREECHGKGRTRKRMCKTTFFVRSNIIFCR